MAEQALTAILERMDQRMQQLEQQLDLQRQEVREQLELQRANTKAQIKAMTALGAAQASKSASVRKAFDKVKPLTGGYKAWKDWRYKFISEAGRSYKDAEAILKWAEEKFNTPISETDIAAEAAAKTELGKPTKN